MKNNNENANEFLKRPYSGPMNTESILSNLLVEYSNWLEQHNSPEEFMRRNNLFDTNVCIKLLYNENKKLHEEINNLKEKLDRKSTEDTGQKIVRDAIIDLVKMERDKLKGEVIYLKKRIEELLNDKSEYSKQLLERRIENAKDNIKELMNENIQLQKENKELHYGFNSISDVVLSKNDEIRDLEKISRGNYCQKEILREENEYLQKQIDEMKSHKKCSYDNCIKCPELVKTISEVGEKQIWYCKGKKVMDVKVLIHSNVTDFTEVSVPSWCPRR